MAPAERAGSVEPADPSDPAAQALALALARPATLGPGRLVCVDGPSGSGKTTLADRLARLSGAPVVHLDELYDGWTGLPRLPEQLDRLLLPLAEGRPGSYRRYDWHAMAYDGVVTVPPAPLLIVEGVGSGSASYARLCTVLVWVEAPYAVRRARGLARDGDAFAPHWDAWARDETALFARERTRERADLKVTTGGAPRPGTSSERQPLG